VESSVRVLAFAGARDVVGAAEIRFVLAAPCTASQLLDDIVRAFPGLQPYRKSVRLAINGTYALSGDAVTDGDEVALIPPVAGG
jgi:molybdopterin converting factor small subunit